MLADHAIGGLAGFALLESVRQAYRRIRGREGLGGGDPKLAGAIGCWLGWRPLPLCIFLAACLGLAVVWLQRCRGRRLDALHRLPFGAMLALAAFAVAARLAP